MSILFVTRIYDGVQTGGNWHGTPATFVRLLKAPGEPHGACGIYMDPLDYPIPTDLNREIPLSKMLRERHNKDEFARVGEATLWTILKSKRGRHAVITGAEPCEYELSRLTELLRGSGWFVQVETCGSATTRLPDHVWFTLRPAAVVDGPLDVIDASLLRANEIVARVHRPADIARLDELLAQRPSSIPVWLVPAGKDKFSYQVCVEAAWSRKWRVSRPPELALAG